MYTYNIHVYIYMICVYIYIYIYNSLAHGHACMLITLCRMILYHVTHYGNIVYSDATHITQSHNVMI